MGGTLFFAANDGTNGYELWKSDGTAAGTVLVKDIYPGGYARHYSSNPANLTNVGGTLFFSANDGTNGMSFGSRTARPPAPSWSRTSTREAYGPNSSNPADLTNVGGTLFFSANDGTTGRELWKVQNPPRAIWWSAR